MCVCPKPTDHNGFSSRSQNIGGEIMGNIDIQEMSGTFNVNRIHTVHMH